MTQVKSLCHVTVQQVGGKTYNDDDIANDISGNNHTDSDNNDNDNDSNDNDNNNDDNDNG